MSTLNYDDLKITTMTLIFALDGTIDKGSAFHLLPITLFKIKQNKDALKCKLPRCEINGAVISIRYKNLVRGIIRSSNPGYFKNSVTLDVATSIKNISIKLSPHTIHLCGAASRDNGIEAANYIIEHLRNIKYIIDKIRANEDEYNKIITWIDHATKGPRLEKRTNELQKHRNINLNIIKLYNDHVIYKTPEIPSHLDKEIIEFFLLLSQDLTYHSDFMNKIRNILNFNPIITDDLKISHVNEVMTNYNYNLGFKVNRDKLNLLMDGRNGFLSRYDNALVDNVTVELPFIVKSDQNTNKRKKKKPHHTFLIYASGACTQSGPGKDLMKDAFYLFLETIYEIKSEIIL